MNLKKNIVFSEPEIYWDKIDRSQQMSGVITIKFGVMPHRGVSTIQTHDITDVRILRFLERFIRSKYKSEEKV